MKRYYIFTDGSTLGNNLRDKSKRKGGIGVYFPFDDKYSLSIPIRKEPSNNRAEITAILLAIRQFNKYIKYEMNKKQNEKSINIDDIKLVIVTDSRFGIDLVVKWMDKWKSQGWRKTDGKEPANLELVKELDLEIERVDYVISMRHLNSHQSAPTDVASKEFFLWHGNNQADLLATSAAKLLSRD